MGRILLGVCAALFVTSAALGRAQPSASSRTLREAAAGRMRIGAAIHSSHLDDPKHATLIIAHFDSLTAGNEFKPDHLQRERGKFTFGGADKIAAFAAEHDMQLIGHTLLWHQQTPRWMFQDDAGKPLSRDAALANLKTHIDTVVKHFKGRVAGWDVVNEAVSDSDKEYLRDTPARRAIGDDYVVKAFEFARAADPDVELYYNDFNIELPGKRERALRLVRELKAAGVRLDAVGIQGHWLLHFPDPKVVDDAIAAFAAEGLRVEITEFDIDVLPRREAGAELGATEKGGADPYRQGLSEDVQRRLAERYGALVRVFTKYPRTVTRVTFWGTTDGNTWLNDWPVKGRTNHPLLFDRAYRPKPAFHAVIDALAAGQK